MMYRLLKIISLLAVLTAGQAQAFAPESTYTRRSVLADGRWVRVEVPETGVYMISNADLRRMGFSNPSAVRIHGYGGERISLHLSAENYIDDLPQVASEVTDRGIVFYARGPVGTESAGGSRIRHKPNPYAVAGAYFVTESAGEAPAMPATGLPGGDNPAETFSEVVFHEQELTSPGETGSLLVGEDFKYQTSRNFRFDLKGRCPDTEVWAEIAFVADCPTSNSSISVAADGLTLPASAGDVLQVTPSGNYSHGSRTVTAKSFTPAGSQLDLTVKFNASGTVKSANLDYICLNYTRRIDLADGPICFSTAESALRVSGAGRGTRIWDVTDPLRCERVNVSADGVWSSLYAGRRRYAVWDEASRLPSPVIVGETRNQNIHGMTATPEMVIFTPGVWRTRAEKLAELHRTADGMTVEVLDIEQVYNEFASGAADASALRRCLKMIYDRGEASGQPLRYALFMGRPTYDNRRLTQKVKALGYPSVPAFQTDNGLSDNDSYSTDDYYSLLLDGAGLNVFTEHHCIATGRIPVTSLAEAVTVTDKICAYVRNAPEGAWTSRALFVADDGDGGRHLTQTERAVEKMAETARGADVLPVKVYQDAYRLRDGVCTDARAEMFRELERGVVWWNYVGHGNPSEWSHEHLLTMSDINSLYLRCQPVLMAATCDFMRWDSSGESGAEVLFKNPDGGVIACVSACRPVSISGNGVLMEAMARQMFDCDASGRILSTGEMLRRAKNALSGNDNKVRYALMGDPAMRPAMPRRRCVVTAVNGTDIADFPVMAARQKAVVEGYVSTPGGEPDAGFSGRVSLTLYDAEYSTVTLGNGDDGVELPFQRHGSRLCVVADSVREGRFRITVPMPDEIADNYSPATLSLHASGADGDAAGLERRVYVYGRDEAVATDTVAPVIEEFYLNHSGFRDGGRVNESPVVMARVSDDTGLNMSLAGVGHQMSLQLDGGVRSFTDVADYFTPDAGGSRSGTVSYPLADLSEGPHTLRLRVWDTSGNAAERTLRFTVAVGEPVRLIKVMTDACPAASAVNFLIIHDRPGRAETVTVEVFDLMGRQVWTSARRVVSDEAGGFPVTWNLNDKGGRRVDRGIYIYRVTAAGGDSVTGKIAVAGY